ncbi:MAG: cytochrome c biogenesis protein CcdA [Chloroflexota bacterium]
MFELFVALIAGLVSFLSPCVLPLVPAYVSYMAGRVTYTVSAQVDVRSSGGAAVAARPSRFAMGAHSLAFVAGFTVIFVMFGVAASALVFVLEDIIIRLGGMIIILFGLHFMGVIPRVFGWLRQHEAVLATPLFSVGVAAAVTAALLWGFTGTVAVWQADSPAWTLAVAGTLSAVVWVTLMLGNAFTQPRAFWIKMLNTLDYLFYADTRRQMSAGGSKGLWGSFTMGLVFSAGWTPCIGPTLGAAMGLAANDGEIATAAMRMGAFSLGLGIPFVITALMLDSAQGQLRRLNRHMNTIKLFTGALLVFIGLMMTTGQLSRLSVELNATFGEVSIRLENCVVGVFRDDISLGQTGTCLGGSVPFELLQAEHTGETPSAAQIRALARTYPDVDLSAYIDPAAVETALEDMPDRAAPDDDTEGAGDSAPADDDAADSGSASAGDAADALTVGLDIGQLAPDFRTTTLDGETVSLGDFRGQFVMLNFWYTTCPPCEIEMPHFQSAYLDYSDEAFTILAVNREETPAQIAPFAERHALTFPLLLDRDSDIQRLYNVRSYPTTYFINPDGVIVQRYFSLLTAAQIEHYILELVEVDSTTS